MQTSQPKAKRNEMNQPHAKANLPRSLRPMAESAMSMEASRESGRWKYWIPGKTSAKSPETTQEDSRSESRYTVYHDIIPTRSYQQ